MLLKNICKYRYQIPKVYIQHSANFNSSNINDKTLRKMKRLFSTLLFGGTFMYVLYRKRAKQKEMYETYKDCRLLPHDNNMKKGAKFFEYQDYILPEFVIKELKTIQNFKAREDDIYVISFPKTGITWLQEAVYLIASDFDLATARQVGLETRFPYLEYIYPGIRSVQKLPSPRLIKTHLPRPLLPPDIEDKGSKMIYIARNPKDVAVSYFHFLRMNTVTEYTGNFHDFIDLFTKGTVPYGPIWDHYLGYWEVRDSPNVLVVFYEELHTDFDKVMTRLAQFLGKSLSPEQLEQLREHCSFSEMAINPSVNYQHWDSLGLRKLTEAPFMRKGIVGDWKNYFSPELNQSFEDWVDQKFGPLKDKFTYQLEVNSRTLPDTRL